MLQSLLIVPLLKSTFESLIVIEKVCGNPSVVLVCSPERVGMAFKVLLGPDSGDVIIISQTEV